jgi:ankyrin repeat protein
MHDTELYNAVLLCDEAAVDAILWRNPALALSTNEQGRSLVMEAVAMGPQANGVSLPILGRLLDAGVDVNAQDQEGCTALALAVGECTIDVLHFLLTRGANPNLGNPLIHALWNDGTSAEDLKVLIAAGADPNAQQVEEMNALEWAEETGDDDFIRLLRRAARRGRQRDGA